MVAAIQGAASALVDLSLGSVLRAVVESAAAMALWLQGIAMQIAALTRFASSTGTDADSWGADFNYSRLPASVATGNVTFARFTSTNQATVNVGVTVQTADGTQSYVVIANTTLSTYNPSLGAYIIPSGTASAVVSVQSVNAATAANVAAGAISILAQAIPYIDTVSNAAAMAGGADAETDTAYKARFPQYFGSLAKATPGAIKGAIQALGANIDFTYTENQNIDGSPHPGYFYVVVDNGTGSPPSGLLSQAAATIEAVRGDSITYGVFTPTLVPANIVMVLTTGSAYVHATVVTAVIAALTAQINALPIGAGLPYTFLSSIAFGVAGVTNVTGITLNGGTADLTTTAVQIIKVGTLVVS